MSLRPDLIGCWIVRIAPSGDPEILLLRRAPGRIYPGLWQCVTGGLEEDERIVDGALREVAEETGMTAGDIEVLYHLDQVNLFHADHADALLAEVTFAARVRPGTEPRLSHEHDAARWVTPTEARQLVVWPAYREAIDRIEWLLANPAQALWFRSGAWATGGSLPPDPASR